MIWDDRTASLKGEQAAHLIRVLRAETGMECDMVAGIACGGPSFPASAEMRCNSRCSPRWKQSWHFR